MFCIGTLVFVIQSLVDLILVQNYLAEKKSSGSSLLFDQFYMPAVDFREKYLHLLGADFD